MSFRDLLHGNAFKIEQIGNMFFYQPYHWSKCIPKKKQGNLPWPKVFEFVNWCQDFEEGSDYLGFLWPSLASWIIPTFWIILVHFWWFLVLPGWTWLGGSLQLMGLRAFYAVLLCFGSAAPWNSLFMSF